MRHRSIDVRILLEKDLHHADAVIGLRLDMLDIIHSGGHGTLVGRDHAPLDLFRRQTRVVPHHTHDRDTDVREDVSGSTQGGDHAEDKDQKGRHNERIGTVERESDEPHHGEFLSQKELRIPAALMGIVALAGGASVTVVTRGCDTA